LALRGPAQQGAQYTYSDLAIESCLRLRLVYSLALRQTQGFLASLFALLKIALPVPDYSTLSRRHASLQVSLCTRKQKDEMEVHVVLDSTGLKVYGPGEWAQRKDGDKRRKTWRKLHLVVDPKTGEITATTLTENKEHDSAQAEPLLEQSAENRGSVDRVGGDGAYDKWRCYDAVAAHGATLVIPPQKNARIRQHGNAKAPPLPRDEANRYIRRHGRAQRK
jgi:IS5 family transposase